MTKKVYLDPGHGGTDPGAVGNGLREKDLTLKISNYTRDYLLNNYQDVQVRMSRTTDTFVSLANRTKDANNWGADVLVSVHINAATSSATGYEDFIWNGKVGQNTIDLQNTIHAEMVKVFKNFRNRGKKRANFHMLRESRMPAILPEFLFITNMNDAAFLKSDSNLQLIAKHLAIGIAKHLNLKQKAQKSNVSSSNSGSSSSGSSGGGNVGTRLYYVQIGAFSVKANADNLLAKVKKSGYNQAYIKKEGNLYKVQVGAFSVKANADRLAAELKKKGFGVYIA